MAVSSCRVDFGVQVGYFKNVIRSCFDQDGTTRQKAAFGRLSSYEEQL